MSDRLLKNIQNAPPNGLRRITSRIIGAEVERGFPAVCKVRIFKRKTSIRDNLTASVCTGTLIAPNLVVFAAHCVERGLISHIVVTFEYGSKEHSVRVDVKKGLSKNLSYSQTVIESSDFTLSEKLKMSRNDIAFLTLPKDDFISAIQPLPMLPLQNLKALKALNLITDLKAVGYGKFSNVEDVNKNRGGKKRSANFDSWRILEQGMIEIDSKQETLSETGEPINIAGGDSGGAILCIYQNVPYLVGVISFYNIDPNDSSGINIRESFAVSTDLVDLMLTRNRERHERISKLFENFRQSFAPYGFNFEGHQGSAFRTIASQKAFRRKPHLEKFREPKIFLPPNSDASLDSILDVRDVEIVGSVKWFRDPRFQLALACAPIAVFAIMGLRLGLEFDDE